MYGFELYYANIIIIFLLIIPLLADDCIIKNQTIIESKWLNDIICIGDNGYRYVNFATLSNNDMIIEITALPGNDQRLFYRMDSKGNQYFTSITATGQTATSNFKYESQIFTININDAQKKEYLISIGKGKYFTEIYDISSNELISQIETTTLLGDIQMNSILQFGFNYYYDNSYYNLFGFIDNTVNFYLKKFKFTTTDLTQSPVVKTYNLNMVFGKVVSCFLTDSYQFILCLYLHEYGYMYIYVYNQDFEEKAQLNLDYYMVPINDNWEYDYFAKCISLKEDAGVFAFYRATDYVMINHPLLFFKRYNGASIVNYYEEIPEVELKYTFKSYCLLNDMIKVSETKICYTGTSETKEQLYIILIDFLESGLIVRYYSIDIFTQYNFKFLLDTRQHLYRRIFISFAFSFCRVSQCETKEDTHFAGLMIFSYPNGTDYNLNLTEYYFKNNNLDNIQIDFKENVTIENNIFGLIYFGISLINMVGCENVSLLSTSDESYALSYGSFVTEKIKIKIKSYTKIECTLGYSPIATEPDSNTYDDNANDIETYGSVTSNNIETKLYGGRLINYNITMDDLTKFSESTIPIIKTTIPLSIPKTTQPISIPQTTQPISIPQTTQPISIPKTTQPISIPKTTQPISIPKTTQPISPRTTQPISPQTTQPISPQTTQPKYQIITTIPKIKDKETEIKKCNTSEILNNGCNNKITNEQVGEIYDQLIGVITKGDFKGNDTVIKTENAIFQISKVEDQKNDNNQGVSSIDIGECEEILKKKNNISLSESLIIFKSDIKNDDLSATYVQYEIYNPNTLIKLSMEPCNKVNIVVNVPVYLDTYSLFQYERLEEAGYNLYDSEDDFYNDICTTYTTENGTDMLLEDRKSEIYNTTGNKVMCQNGCKFESYNKITQKAKCNCNVQIQSTQNDITKIDFSKGDIAEKFLTPLKNSNFFVLKCYKLVISLDDIMKNIGRIIMAIIYFLFLICLFIYIISDRKKINLFINTIMKYKLNLINKYNNEKTNKIKPKNEKNEKSEKIKKNKNKEENKNNKKDKNKLNNKKKNSRQKDKSENKNENKSNKMKKSKDEIKRKNKDKYKVKNKSKNKIDKKAPPKKKGSIFNNNDTINSTMRNINTKSPKKNNKLNKININIIPIKNINYNNDKKNKIRNICKFDNKKVTNYKQKPKFENYKVNTDINDKGFELMNYKNLNDQELNNLEYNMALIIDKRSYFQYYWSLLKKKQLILFTILPSNDYNLFSLKLSLFLLSFSLYFTINGFFFTDDTMHKIYEDKGAFNIIYQIPQIIYSSGVSSIINMILKTLSLSESNILILKQEKNFNVAKKKSKNIMNYLLIKFIIFFLLSNLLLLFFWYFISCFCAVYVNTQKILIKDTLISFALSMAYPFGLNLLPGMFRIPALRAAKKDKKCLYKISGIIALI